MNRDRDGDGTTRARVLVRRAVAADAAAIAALHVASWRATYRGDLPAEFLAALDPVARAERFREALTLPRVTVLVGVEADRLAGFAAFGPTRDPDLDPATVAQLYHLHVAPDRWNGGVGDRLWRRMVTALQGDWTALCLWVLPGNARARRFYERRGLATDGASGSEELAPGVAFERVRYRAPLSRLGAA